MFWFQWQCPACQSPLRESQFRWSCANNHSYDKAKQGYVNLLLAQHRNSKQPGDSKAMIDARRAFLTQGHYTPLINKLTAYIVKFFVDLQGSVTLFDAGCGEGYYLEQIVSGLENENIHIHISGVDISKPAIQKAAKSLKQGYFAVASTYAIPVQTATQDLVLQVFAPSSQSEIARILKNNGLWIQVSPGPEHLFELKQHVYDNPEKHLLRDDVPEDFLLKDSIVLRFDMNLTSRQERESLLMMTPFYWQINEQKKDALLTSLTQLTAEFHIQVFYKADAKAEPITSL